MKNQILNGTLIALALVIVAGFFIWPVLSLSCPIGSGCDNIGWWAIGLIFVAAIVAIVIIIQNKKEPAIIAQNSEPQKNYIMRFLKIIIAVVIVIFVALYAYNTLFVLQNSETSAPGTVTR